ncbi:alpha/beta fold hydrolase [Tenacibaculum sp. M341]|nr:alpha/beta fold hydrolase [Tenacibaculum sp. M341]
MKLFKKIIKILLIVLLLGVVILYFVFSSFTAPKSDSASLALYEQSVIQPKLSKEIFRGMSFRKIEILKDTTLPTLVFVHGAVGSLNDFSAYMSDSLLQTKANMIAYDRVGYGYQDKHQAQENIAFERDVLKDIIKGLNKDKVILVGYSYGGPITLAVKEKVKKIILLAPAVSSKDEVEPWMINFYKWSLTRWLVPDVWKQASKEKLSHKKDLSNFEKEWSKTPNKVVTVHGTADWIVPYENSKFIERQFSKEDFKFVSIPEAGHGFIWSNYEEIRQQLLKELD